MRDGWDSVGDGATAVQGPIICEEEGERRLLCQSLRSSEVDGRLLGDGEVDITEFDITESDVTFFQEIDITESDVTKKGN